MAILSISKEVMYDFHYNFIHKHFPDVLLGFTDTDSFMYSLPCECEDISQKLKDLDPEGKWMDFSNYPKGWCENQERNRLVPGKFKDEGAGIHLNYEKSKLLCHLGSPFTEGFFLRSKMYHIENVEDALNKSTAKGITRAAKEQHCRMEEYKKALFGKERKVPKVTMHRIASKNHKLYTVEQKKKGLSCYNDKIYLERDGDSFITHSFGHYKLLEKTM